MKKTIVLLTAVITVVALAASSIGFTLAYFTDKAVAVGAEASAGYLDVSMDLALANYGVPSDRLEAYYGSKKSPEQSAVTVTNKGSTAMDYTLRLTIDEGTAELLAKDGFELKDAGNNPLTLEAVSDLVYVYKSTSALASEAVDTFGIALTFKGAELVDGNDYQDRAILIDAEVEAVQEGGA